MFIAKFNVAQGDMFTADKNQNMPWIGQVLAGSYHSSIINGTIAAREGLVANKVYACENEQVELVNETTGQVTKVYNVVVVSEVSLLEYAQLKSALGAAKRILPDGPETVAPLVEAFDKKRQNKEAEIV